MCESTCTVSPCAILQSKYYSEKLGIHKHDAAGRRRVASSFIEGLHWVLEYYYRGVASWTWFFPYHFAPMISDMTDIQEFDVAFQLGQPFLPFQQLLGVLPSASFKLLPEPFQVGLICPLIEAFAFQLGWPMLLEFYRFAIEATTLPSTHGSPACHSANCISLTRELLKKAQLRAVIYAYARFKTLYLRQVYTILSTLGVYIALFWDLSHLPKSGIYWRRFDVYSVEKSVYTQAFVAELGCKINN